MKTYRYTGWLAFVAGFFLVASLSRAGEAYHTFTDMEGRSIKGLLMGFDADRQVATIQRDDDRICWVALAVFSEADQQYVRKQGPGKNFMCLVKISTSLSSLGKSERNFGNRYKAEHVKCYDYAIILENRSCSRFDAVDIEYCIFYRQGEYARRRMVFAEGVQCGRLKIDPMMPRSEHYLKTETVLICDENNRSSGLFGSDGGARGAIHGIWLRIATTLPSVERITREFCSPRNIGNSKAWTTTMVLAGLNK